jgi:uroporphyrinogen decarboxylase
LIGFAGSPWTIACYMVEGGSSKDFSLIRKMLYQEPAQLEKLLSILQQSITHYLNAQIAAGVDIVMIFDTWGGILTPEMYQQYSLQPMQKIIADLDLKQPTKTIPSILFTKNGGQWLESMAQTGCSALGLDWTTNIGEARARVGGKVALQGNLDPALLLASPEKIEAGVAKVLSDFGQHNGHIFNLGHGITPNVPPEHVAVLVDAVHRLGKQYH